MIMGVDFFESTYQASVLSDIEAFKRCMYVIE
jgi:hypothetical protein